MNSNKECNICKTQLEVDNLIRLQCFHAFHYDCILQWYVTAKESQKYYNYHRSCPLCRKKGGYLPLKFNDKPIYGIHEGGINEGGVNEGVNEGGEQYFYQCSAIIKSKKSPKYGKECGNFTTSNYCGIHKHLYT